MKTEGFKTGRRKVRERSVERYLTEQVKKLGGLCWKFESPGLSGVPDRIVVFMGYVVFVELKRPGQKPRELQRVRLHTLRSAGAWTEVVSTKDEADQLLAKLCGLKIPKAGPKMTRKDVREVTA